MAPPPGGRSLPNRSLPNEGHGGLIHISVSRGRRACSRPLPRTKISPVRRKSRQAPGRLPLLHGDRVVRGGAGLRGHGVRLESTIRLPKGYAPHPREKERRVPEPDTISSTWEQKGKGKSRFLHVGREIERRIGGLWPGRRSVLARPIGDTVERGSREPRMHQMPPESCGGFSRSAAIGEYVCSTAASCGASGSSGNSGESCTSRLLPDKTAKSHLTSPLYKCTEGESPNGGDSTPIAKSEIAGRGHLAVFALAMYLGEDSRGCQLSSSSGKAYF